jgi:hypothetical protein
VDLKHTVNQYRNKPINQVKQLKPKAMKAKNRILVVKESVAKKIAEGDYVKLGVLFKEDSRMIIHGTINDRPKPKEGMKPIKVEYERNNGYWAKWYLAYNSKHAKELFQDEYPDGKYYRCRSY